ncbi:MAG: Na+/H+ antiporter NhaC family protein, partial [Phascolarctobacterium sp.]|nr:Na+/H+ antiporter NhaC family protein [Phascolarctobacterium sp.]
MALLPIFVFIVLFVGSGIITGDFYLMPTTMAFLVALFVALLQNKNLSFEQKLVVAASGAGDVNIITMCIIYLLAGVFSAVVTAAGGVTSTVSFALSIIPVDFAVTGLFLMGCFISLAMGTSCGTIAALAPISVDIATKTGYNPAMCIGAVVCGAMFGDNLSLISDTTIAAVRTQGCEMVDKFKANFKIVLPAAIATVLIFYSMSTVMLVSGGI